MILKKLNPLFIDLHLFNLEKDQEIFLLDLSGWCQIYYFESIDNQDEGHLDLNLKNRKKICSAQRIQGKNRRSLILQILRRICQLRFKM